MSTIYAKLLEAREELGGYVTYVFRDLSDGKPVMCTKFKNWATPPISIMTKGYLSYKEIIAGRDTWYDAVKNEFVPYKFDYVQFINFVEERNTSTIDYDITY